MQQPEPFGKFLLLGQVAVGGMAEIYRARYADPAMPQEDIALKRILPSYTEDEGFVTMFKDEGNIAIRLKHPNIVNIFEVGEVNNDWYIAMEFIHGTDLRILSDACEKYQKRFTPTQIARVACETAKALDYAHACKAADGTPLNIVHRDCTPHNIMISEQGEVKLMDFGIAKAASRATKTRVGTVKGKSSYMSPEQAKGKTLDGRSDMFTLATVTWELLTGYRLFKASTDFDILRKVLKSDIIHPSEMDANVPRGLGDIVMRALQRDKEARYPTCGAMAVALENWISLHGDGSDRKLGDFVMAMTNAKGHSYMELPDYIPGDSIYECVDGDFKLKGEAEAQAEIAAMSAPSFSINEAPAVQQVSAVSNPIVSKPSLPPIGVPQMAMPPQYPEPSALMPPTTNNVPKLYIALYIILLLMAAGGVAASLHFMKADTGEKPKYEAPDAFVNFKTKPTEATVTVNGVQVIKDGRPELTNVYSQRKRLGDNLSITFEKEDYEPVTVERRVVMLSQDIEVMLYKPDELAAMKAGAVPKFSISASPDNATITVNGENKGKSPVTLENVKYGTELKIEVIPEDKAYDTTEQVFLISKDCDSSLTIPMEKATGGKGKKDRAKANQPPKNQPPKQAAAPAGEGKITIATVPWANIWVDGKSAGSTATKAVTVTVSAGSHTVKVKQPQQRKEASKSVTVKPNQTVNISYNFASNSWK